MKGLAFEQAKANPHPEELPDLPNDREQIFSNSFVDPGMDEMLPDISLDLGSAEGPEVSIVHEAADALQELVLDASNVEEDLSALFPQGEETLLPADQAGEIEPGLDVAAEANELLVLEDSNETALLLARADMADQLFALVANDRSFDELVEKILLTLQSALCAQAGSILEYDRAKSEFFFRATVGGNPEKLKAFRVPAMKGIVGHVAETLQPLLLRSLETDQTQLQAISMSTGLETRTCVAAPIVVDNQLYGVIELFNKLSADHFDEKDLQILEEGARMASKVLEVRFLVAELLRRAGK